MSIDTTYRKILTENFLLDELKKGEIPSAEEIQDKVNDLIATLDLTKPQFKADDFTVESRGSSSASSFNSAQLAILQDLRALYKEMLSLGDVATDSYERWALESDVLEKRLADLEDRIQNLLLLTRDTEGYHSYLVDNFSDATLVDRDLSTATVDPVAGLVVLGPTNTTDTRLYLNDLDVNKDISFKIRSTIDFVSRNDAARASLANIFKQTSATWWTNITMRSAKPVTCELVVKLGEEPVTLSRIFMRLHDTTRSTPVTVTPLYSVDNFTFSQLPTLTYTQQIRSQGTFAFEEVEAKWIKFILTKTGPDPITNSSSIVYQFGFKEISFYTEGFDIEDEQMVVSVPLSVTSLSNPNEKVEFSKLTVEVCERVETDTEIKYFVTASDDPTVPITASTIWIPVSPVSSLSTNQPAVVDLGDLEEIEKGVDEAVGISYDVEEDDELINPAAEFHLLSLDANGVVQDETITADDVRYAFTNENERILDYQLKDVEYDGSGGDPLTIDENRIVLFRNVGAKGLGPEDPESLVRGIQRGWKFEEPFYITTVEIKNPTGISIDFGDRPVFIDDVKYTNLVGPTVLTGKTPTTTGLHVIKVQKDNWLAVEPDLITLDDLKEADKLYPFNHKLLVEGYNYPTNYDANAERVYVGVDVFASELMKKVSIFDLAGSVDVDQWKFYALDRDAPDTHEDGNLPTRVIVVKVDNETADFSNERFVLRFNLINQRYKYLRFRADLSTENEKVSPALDSYKIKLGG